jgi:hypothetical protein
MCTRGNYFYRAYRDAVTRGIEQRLAEDRARDERQHRRAEGNTDRAALCIEPGLTHTVSSFPHTVRSRHECSTQAAIVTRHDDRAQRQRGHVLSLPARARHELAGAGASPLDGALRDGASSSIRACSAHSEAAHSSPPKGLNCVLGALRPPTADAP